jgi:hypothetical protein
MEEEQASLEEQSQQSKDLDAKVACMQELSTEVKKLVEYMEEVEEDNEVGLCTLNQVDP